MTVTPGLERPAVTAAGGAPRRGCPALLMPVDIRQMGSHRSRCSTLLHLLAMATMPTRIERDLFEAARQAGEVHSRSAAQQIDHWARIGRELETSPAVTHDHVARVLAGTASYDALGDSAQAVVRARWDEEIAERAAALDLEADLLAAGDSWVEADADGKLVVRRAPE